MPARLSGRVQPRRHRAATAASSRSTARIRNPVTDGFICAKVRQFGERVYGPDRLLHPAVRTRPQRRRQVRARHVGRSARISSPTRFEQAKAASRRRSRSCRSRTADRTACSRRTTSTRTLWRRFGTSRLARTVCAAPTGAANMALYGKMPSVAYQDYPDAKLIVLWGVNPSASGIHLVPYVREAQKRGAKLVVIDPRATQLAQARRSASGGRSRAPTSPSRSRSTGICSRTATPTRRSCASTRTGVGTLRERARAVDDRAAARVAGIDAAPRSSASRSCTRRARPRSCAAAGASSATATAATPRWRCSRCRRSAASSACAAAATR